MPETNLEKLHGKLIEIFDVFHNICIENDLTYYMVGGTMLGAVRHKGFIPWDDDIDVAMPREDYEKLLHLPKNIWPKNLQIDTPSNTNNWVIPFSKLVDTNTTLIEERVDGDKEGSVFIDIFPLDGAGNNMISAKFKYYRFAFKRRLIVYKMKDRNSLNLIEKFIRSIIKKRSVNSLHDNMVNSMKISSFKNSQIIGNYSGAWGIKEFFEKEIMGTPQLYEFQNKKYYGVKKSDAYLTSLYGDYMKLPSKDKQKSHHKLKIVDL